MLDLICLINVFNSVVSFLPGEISNPLLRSMPAHAGWRNSFRECRLSGFSPPLSRKGVNNRNLGTFHTDVENSFRLAEKLPKEMLLVSESGISSPQTVRQLRAAGFRGFLIGENFMKTPQPGNALKEFISKL